MIETLDELYKGSATIIKNKNYFSTKEYIDPFIEKLNPYTDKVICLAKSADQTSKNELEINTIYNKVLLIDIFSNSYDIVVEKQIYHRVICMNYVLDVKTPVYKFYTGVIDDDLNFYAFGANCIQIQKIECDTPFDFSGLNKLIDNGLNDNCEYILKQNLTRNITKKEILNELGNWIDFTLKKEYINDSGKIKLSTTLPINAYKELMIDKDSKFYLFDNNLSYSLLLKTFINQLTIDNKDIINRYEKTQLINQMLKL